METQDHLHQLFEDEEIVRKIKTRLPYLFQLAGLESSRAGKLGMQVGSVRESVLVALLIYKFGKENVETEIPITEPEVDVRVFGEPISIKTITGKGFSGVKISWTVDTPKAREFQESYEPTCGILFAQINWDDDGWLYYIPIHVQKRLLEQIGAENYVKLPKLATNPRGVEFGKGVVKRLVMDEQTMRMKINWRKSEINFNPYKRWLDLWRED